MSAPAPAVRADGVGFTIGATALVSEVSFTAQPGELLALVGPNGAGKSTMLGLLAGDLVPTTGTIDLAGLTPHRAVPRELARRRSVMTQQHQQAFSFTVRELVEMGRAPHEASADDEAIVAAALADADVEHLAGRDVTTLSGGELARAVFARTLAQDTPVVLLDEPTAALDLRHQEAVLQRAAALAHEGRCVLVVLHDLSLAARCCDRIAMFSTGRLAALGVPEEVLTAERIAEVYGQQVAVMRHPVTDRPLIVPV